MKAKRGPDEKSLARSQFRGRMRSAGGGRRLKKADEDEIEDLLDDLVGTNPGPDMKQRCRSPNRIVMKVNKTESVPCSNAVAAAFGYIAKPSASAPARSRSPLNESAADGI